MEIGQGSFLLQVPKNAGGATIRTATVTAAITGTTTMMEYNPGQWIKFITLEGTAKLRMNRGGNFVEIPPGQMIFMRADANRIPRPIMINVQKLMRTSKLTGRQFRPLAPETMQMVAQTIREQNDARNSGEVSPAGLINGGPTIRGGGGRNPDPSGAPGQNPLGGHGAPKPPPMDFHGPGEIYVEPIVTPEPPPMDFPDPIGGNGREPYNGHEPGYPFQEP